MIKAPPGKASGFAQEPRTESRLAAEAAYRQKTTIPALAKAALVGMLTGGDPRTRHDNTRPKENDR